MTTILSLQQVISLVVLLTTSFAVSLQDTLSLLPCVNEHNTIASPCTPLPQHAADAATVNAFSPLPPAAEQQPDVLEVLTQHWQNSTYRSAYHHNRLHQHLFQTPALATSLTQLLATIF